MFCANLNENLAYVGRSDVMLACTKFWDGRDRWLEGFSCFQFAVVSSILDKAHLRFDLLPIVHKGVYIVQFNSMCGMLIW